MQDLSTKYWEYWKNKGNEYFKSSVSVRKLYKDQVEYMVDGKVILIEKNKVGGLERPFDPIIIV